ncbi:DUF5667 domain-containing protein [Nocardioides sp. Soil805]|uniref:DUF5667 domain-containing protein n=1 Tax=Nocardioides sp. Soil805 TaxID=1736416 RepID=UPI000703A032|nr:DUF5667 domain-containing protein [Nocardioides sp. Soil805]KRF37156.1 hypothetical protein ASG94_07300 [Nocardioides sp. Soil805]
MTVPFSGRRRAEEFDALLARRAGPGDGPPLTERDAERFADLLAVVDDLRGVPEVVARPEFTAALRERLMAEADTALVAGPARAREDEARLVLPPRARTRDRRLAALLGGAALIGATSSMAVAAQTALPGDSLYPVKRAIEDARTDLSSGDADKGARLLASARGRLDEVDELARTDSPTRDAAVADTLVLFDEQATSASGLLLDAYAASGDEQVITSLRTFTADSLDRLAALEPVVPESARDELVAAGSSLAAMDARAASACPACAGGVGTLPPFLLSASAPGQDVGTVLSASSASIIDRGRTGQPAIPTTISGQDVGGIVVPDLDTTLGGGTPDGTTGGATTGVPGTPGGTGGPGNGPAEETVKGTVKGTVDTTVKGVDDVTKLLTGDVPALVDEVPVVGPVVGPVVDGVVGGVGGAVDGAGDGLDQTTDSLLD